MLEAFILVSFMSWYCWQIFIAFNGLKHHLICQKEGQLKFKTGAWLKKHHETSILQSVQFSVAAQLCPTLCNPMDCSWPGLPVHHQLPELTHVHWVSDAIQSFDPLSSPSPPTFNLSQHQGLFQRVSSSHQVAKFWSFSFSTSPSNEYSGLISFRMDWLDLLAVLGTLKSLLQHDNSKASIFWHAAFFIVHIQYVYPYILVHKSGTYPTEVLKC